MSLSPVKTVVKSFRVVISKAFEYFTGGFSVSNTTHDKVILPEGSLVRVDESARTTSLVKTGRLTQKAPSNVKFYVSNTPYQPLFEVGDVVNIGQNTASAGGTAITSIVASGEVDVITIATAIASQGTANRVMFEVTSSGSSAANLAPKTVANAIVAHDTKIGGSLTALRRGTVYKNRLQPNLAAHLADLPSTIQLSDSK